MSITEPPTNEVTRLNFRLPPEAKEKIERAAVVSGLTVTDFAIHALSVAADEVIETHRMRTLSNRDRDLFLALLDGDQKPNAALKKAAKDYQRYMKR